MQPPSTLATATATTTTTTKGARSTAATAVPRPCKAAKSTRSTAQRLVSDARECHVGTCGVELMTHFMDRIGFWNGVWLFVCALVLRVSKNPCMHSEYKRISFVSALASTRTPS